MQAIEPKVNGTSAPGGDDAAAMRSAPDARFTLVTDWQVLDPVDGAAIGEFWKRENAIADDAQAAKRLTEVVAHARTADGTVAAVCTAVAVTLPRFGQPMYYYRCFVGRAWRSTRLVFSMLRCAQSALEAYARERDFPCIGMLIELENARFGTTLRTPLWPNSGFVYVGRSGRGFDLRAYYFRGARLKPTPAAKG
ncbi:MAG TPA: hypothetical protein VFG55_02385 [Rhodanobacteraceae bacterium]|nr:hypothetical protein [Rhodanobacteraceae bacterium]